MDEIFSAEAWRKVWTFRATFLTGFGNTLAKGVKEAVQEDGILGAGTGGLKATAGGITAAVFFGLLAALIFKPKDKS